MEGILTGDFISKGYQNTWADYCTGDPDFCLKLGRFLADNTKWMMTQIDSNPDDKYWYQVRADCMVFLFVSINLLYSLTVWKQVIH